MKFHPIISIILGLIVFSVLFITSFAVYTTSIVEIAIFISALILGGFIATYFSKNQKIRYSAYLGLISAFLFSIMEYQTGFSTIAHYSG